MKFIHTHKKVAVAGLALVVAVMTGGAAYAYFTQQGTGTGSGVVGNAGAFVISSNSPSGLLYPDTAGSSANVETTGYSVTNTGHSSAQLDQVTISVAAGDGSAWTYKDGNGDPACTAADFSIDGATPGTPFVDTSQAGTYAAGQTQTGSVTLEMIDNGQNQDSCEAVTVPIYFTTGYPGVVATNPSVLSLDGPVPNLGSASFYPNPDSKTVPTVTSNAPVTLSVAVFDSGAANGSISVSYDNAYLTFTSATDSLACATVTSGTNSTVTCTYNDLSHSSGVTKPFNFTTAGPGTTTATETVTVGSDTATETFGLIIS
jgi:hypothetical protein